MRGDWCPEVLKIVRDILVLIQRHIALDAGLFCRSSPTKFASGPSSFIGSTRSVFDNGGTPQTRKSCHSSKGDIYMLDTLAP